MARRLRVALLPLLLGVGCEADLDTKRREATRGDTFGAIIYQEVCQRVAYLSEREEREANRRETVDVSASIYGPVCASNEPAPANAPLKVKALQQQRPSLVSVVNLIMPKSFLDSMEAFLEAIVPLHDDGTLEAAIISAADALQVMIDDAGFAPALARLAPRTGYRPLSAAAGLTPVALRYPELDSMLAATLDLLLDGEGNPGTELKALLDALAREATAASAEADPGAPERTLRLALDLLFAPSLEAGSGKPRPVVLRDHRGFSQVAPDKNGGVALPFADLNFDGLPDLDKQGRPTGPSQKLVTVTSPFPVPGVKDPPNTMRDAQGRLLRDDGTPFYRYLDLDGTVLGALVAEGATLLDPLADNALGLLHGAGALLGNRVTRTKDYKDSKGSLQGTLRYQGFAVKDAALLDLAHALIQILGAPKARETLLAARTLLGKYEDKTARSLGAMLDVSDRGKQDTSAMIPADSTLFDELIPIIVRVLQVPGLAEDLVTAMSDPRVKGLAPAFARQMMYRERYVLNQSSLGVEVRHPDTGSFATAFTVPVDRKRADDDWNRSVMQRMAHLIHDANGTEFCNKEGAVADIPIIGFFLGNYRRCEMFRIEDLGLFFALAIADDWIVDDTSRPETRGMASFREHMGEGALKDLLSDGPGFFGDDMIETLTGIPGFTRFPTPEAAARSLFLDSAHQSDFMRGAIDPITCSDGDRFIDVHNDSIFAWEVNVPGEGNFYNALRPLINAFALHDECAARDRSGGCIQYRNAVKIFLDLVSVLHVHWSSPGSKYFGRSFQSTDRNAARFSTGDRLVSYEPLLGDVLGQSDLVPSIINLSPTLKSMTLDGTLATPRALPSLLSTASYVFDPKVTPSWLAYRDGRTTTFQSDGKTPVPRATPYYLIADAYAKKRAAFAAAPSDRQSAWRQATSTLVDSALTVEKTGGNTWRNKNRRLHGVTLAAIDFLLKRYDAHATAKDVTQWVSQDLIKDLTDAVDGPLFAGLVDLTARIESDPQTLSKLYGLLFSFVDTNADDRNFNTALVSMADLVQLLLDDGDLVPIAHVLGATLDPARGPVAPQLRLLKKARDLDPNRPTRTNPNGEATLVTVLRNLFQTRPNDAPLPVSDLGDVIAEVNRVEPGKGGDLDAADYRHLFGELRSFFNDEQRGFLHFIRIVKSRHPAE